MIFKIISDLCLEKGISISKLEKECELGNCTIRGWKNSSPTIDNLKKVADYFQIPIEQLLIEK